MNAGAMIEQAALALEHATKEMGFTAGARGNDVVEWIGIAAGWRDLAAVAALVQDGE